MSELIHADRFADFLEMASYLLQQGYRDAAAVYTKLDRKNVTAWLGLRNKPGMVITRRTPDQVMLTLQGVESFATRYPA